jgi:acyl carrier protein
MNDVREQLQEIFRETFEDDSLVLRDDLSAADVPNWDSLAHINMIISVEAKFKIKFATAEISAMKAPGRTALHFLALLEKKLAEKSRRPE